MRLAVSTDSHTCRKFLWFKALLFITLKVNLEPREGFKPPWDICPQAYKARALNHYAISAIAKELVMLPVWLEHTPR